MKLNLGAGETPLEGYENLDAKNGASLYPLLGPKRFSPAVGDYHNGYSDDSVDEVRASHVLEHFPHYQTLDVLKEWVRVLKPGGWLKIAVPDFDWIVGRHLGGTFIAPAGFPGTLCAMSDDRVLPLEAFLMGGQTDKNDYHKAIFTQAKLRTLFEWVGLANVQEWESEIRDCASLSVSLNLMAQKPGVLNV